jgi:hypothetical protein
MTTVGTFNVEVAFVGYEVRVVKSKKDIMATGHVSLDFVGLVGSHDLESYPAREDRVSSKPYD